MVVHLGALVTAKPKANTVAKAYVRCARLVSWRNTLGLLALTGLVATNSLNAELLVVWHTNDLCASTNGMASWYDLHTNYYCVTNPTGSMFFRGSTPMIGQFTNTPVTNVVVGNVVSYFTNYFDNGMPGYPGGVYYTLNYFNYGLGGPQMPYTNVYTGTPSSTVFQWSWCGNCAVYDPGCGCLYGWGYHPPSNTNECIIINYAVGQIINGTLHMGPTNSFQTYSPTNSITVDWPYYYTFTNSPAFLRALPLNN